MGSINRSPVLKEILSYDGLVKSLFVNDFEHFGEKALMMFSVKKCPAHGGI
jgi:hypothetical protein